MRGKCFDHTQQVHCSIAHVLFDESSQSFPLPLYFYFHLRRRLPRLPLFIAVALSPYSLLSRDGLNHVQTRLKKPVLHDFDLNFETLPTTITAAVRMTTIDTSTTITTAGLGTIHT